jgi:hypothetical protein
MKPCCHRGEIAEDGKFVCALAKCSPCRLTLSICDICPYINKSEKEIKDLITVKIEPKLPPIEKQVKNFAESLVKIVQSGFEIVTQEEETERLGICSTCEFLNKDWRCCKCGCFMTIKAKLKVMDCPEGKWPKPKEKEDNQGDCGCVKH